ncbi:hypothetical protein CEN49_21020 [Fischerella thermalis CCMEE 5273]|nr:hypothetical protein CEN49_21020 [Fischerella thermalis CCMEE 5273]
MKLGLLFQKTDETKDKVEVIETTTTTFQNVVGSPVDSRRPVRTNTIIKREEERKPDQELFATLGFNFRPWENHLFTVGTEGSLHDREKKKITTEQQIAPQILAAVEKTAPKDVYRIEENQFNIFVQDEIRLSDQHTLTAGLRIETVDHKATAGDSSTVEQSGTTLNPSLHYKYQMFPTTVFRLSAARTVRRPKFDDFVPFRETKNGTLTQPDVIGNPKLKPETSIGVEAGIEQSWGNHTGAFGLNAFYRWIDDKIENEINLNPENNRYEQSPRNVGNGKVYGLRLDLQTRTPFLGLPNLTLFGNISFLGSEVKDKISGEIRRFREQPAYVANLGFDYTIPEWGMNFGLTYNILPGFENSQLKDGKNEVTKLITKNPVPSLVLDMLRILLTYPHWLAAAVVSTIIVAALEPSLSWMGKKVVDDLKQGGTDINASLVNYILVFGGLLFGLGLIKFGDKLIDKIYEARLIICLQRTYLQRRNQERDAEDISHILYHCNRAKPGLDIIHKDSWKIISQTISVVIWQLNLAPKWLPALLIAVIPPILIGLIFGQFIQKASLKMLTAQESIAASTTEAKKLELIEHQELFFRHTIQLEVFKSGTEILIDLITWFGLLVLVLLSSVFHIGVVPKEVQAGDLVLFWGNLNLLSKPLGDIVKVYNKAREAYPALIRVLRPSVYVEEET